MLAVHLKSFYRIVQKPRTSPHTFSHKMSKFNFSRIQKLYCLICPYVLTWLMLKIKNVNVKNIPRRLWNHNWRWSSKNKMPYNFIANKLKWSNWFRYTRLLNVYLSSMLGILLINQVTDKYWFCGMRLRVAFWW